MNIIKDKYKFYCIPCNYGTNIKHSLLQHYETELHKTGHRKKKPTKIKEEYKCIDCDYKSTNKNNYVTHRLNNHSTKDERKEQFKFYCEYCDFGVFTESSMEKHNQTIRHLRLSK